VNAQHGRCDAVAAILGRARPERLSFNVTASPAPLQELTFSDSVAPPHLDGYLRPKRGEFRLVPLAGGRYGRVHLAGPG